MRFLFLIASVCITFFAAAQCSTEMRGTYFGRNIYVQNPANGNGSWCTDSVLLNGKPLAFENSSVFEINPAKYGLQPCDTMHLLFLHDCGCKPWLVIEMHLQAGNTTFTSVSIDSTGLLQWSVNFDCLGYAPEFQVIRLQWDSSWIVEKYLPQEVKPSGMYSCHIPLYPGENTFRVLAKPHYASNNATSSPAKITINKEPITWQYDAAQNKIVFSDTTRFRIIDEKGKVIQSLNRSKAFTLVKAKGKKRWMYYANYTVPVEIEVSGWKRKKRMLISMPI